MSVGCLRARLDHAGTALLPAVAYGDCAGSPFEGEPAQSNTGSRLSSYTDGIAGSVPAGVWTDDTQLSVAVTRALIGAGGFDLDRIADEHVVSLEAAPLVEVGGITVVWRWGPSTVAAIDRVRRGVPARAAGTVGGAGNGVLMKLAPLVWWQVACGVGAAGAVEQWDAFTTLTHDSSIARVCTRVHGTVLWYLLDRGGQVGDIVEIALSAASQHERLLGAEPHVSEELSFLRDCVPGDCEARLRARVCRRSGRGDNLYGFYAPETLAVVYGAFLQWGSRRSLGDIVYGVISLGGDTDTTAAIVSAMAVFGAGGDLDWPADMPLVMQLDELRGLSGDLVSAARGATGGPTDGR